MHFLKLSFLLFCSVVRCCQSFFLAKSSCPAVEVMRDMETCLVETDAPMFCLHSAQSIAIVFETFETFAILNFQWFGRCKPFSGWLGDISISCGRICSPGGLHLASTMYKANIYDINEAGVENSKVSSFKTNRDWITHYFIDVY